MKNIALILLIGTLFVGCSKDETAQLGTLNISLQTNGGEVRGEANGIETPLSEVNVNRPTSVLAWVDVINIEAKSNESSYSITENFKMKDDNSGEETITLSEVALGTNTVNVEALSYEQNPIFEFKTVKNGNNNLNKHLDSLKSLIPNTNYSASQQVIITEGTEGTTSMQLTANSGRNITLFNLDEDLRNRSNYYAVITLFHNLNNFGVFEKIDTLTLGQEFNNEDDLVSFYWSDEDKTVKGTKIRFQVDIYETTSVGLTDSRIQELEITNGESLSTIFTISGEGITGEANSFDFGMTWQESIGTQQLASTGISNEWLELTACEQANIISCSSDELTVYYIPLNQYKNPIGSEEYGHAQMRLCDNSVIDVVRFYNRGDETLVYSIGFEDTRYPSINIAVHPNSIIIAKLYNPKDDEVVRIRRNSIKKMNGTPLTDIEGPIGTYRQIFLDKRSC